MFVSGALRQDRPNYEIRFQCDLPVSCAIQICLYSLVNVSRKEELFLSIYMVEQDE